jgi:hypothetical protein
LSSSHNSTRGVNSQLVRISRRSVQCSTYCRYTIPVASFEFATAGSGWICCRQCQLDAWTAAEVATAGPPAKPRPPYLPSTTARLPAVADAAPLSSKMSNIGALTRGRFERAAASRARAARRGRRAGGRAAGRGRSRAAAGTAVATIHSTKYGCIIVTRCQDP